MACNPFTLSNYDASAFMATVTPGVLNALPAWGGMFQWNNRVILVYEKPDSTFALTDVTSGIPWSDAPGGCIPGAAFKEAFGSGYTASPTEAFFMSLPSNFMSVAKTTFDGMIAAGQYVATAAGDIVSSAVSPLSGILIPVAVIAAVVFTFVYLPKKGK